MDRDQGNLIIALLFGLSVFFGVQAVFGLVESGALAFDASTLDAFAAVFTPDLFTFALAMLGGGFVVIVCVPAILRIAVVIIKRNEKK